MTFKTRDKDDGSRAVSPVIGVILMVAITVILAAVIAAFVLDIGDTSANPSAGFDINQDGDYVESVQIQTIDRLDSVRIQGENCDVMYNDGTDDGAIIDSWGTANVNNNPGVGDRISFATDSDDPTYGSEIGSDAELCERDDLQIIGSYDGNEAVLIG